MSIHQIKQELLCLKSVNKSSFIHSSSILQQQHYKPTAVPQQLFQANDNTQHMFPAQESDQCHDTGEGMVKNDERTKEDRRKNSKNA